MKFDKNVTKFIISIILASRDGVSESEIVSLLENSSLVKGMSHITTHKTPTPIITLNFFQNHLMTFGLSFVGLWDHF